MTAHPFWNQAERSDGCWEWTGVRGPQGYGQTRSPVCGERRAHRASWVLTHGPIPIGLSICHRCDNPRCVRPDHLFLSTPFGNAIDIAIKGRHGRSSRSPSCLARQNRKADRRARDLVAVFLALVAQGATP